MFWVDMATDEDPKGKDISWEAWILCAPWCNQVPTQLLQLLSPTLN